MTSRYIPTIGLEVHAELLTQSKMFCGCPVVDSTMADPNTAVCEICTGMPGTLPVINRRAVEYAIRVALALDCSVAPQSVFARKNYFYPDLPKGFQISQYEMPLAVNGFLMIDTDEGPKRIGIRRVHLEEDTGKLFHHKDHSLVDYNRSGVPLLEIVTEPDLISVEEAKAYATTLRSVLRYLEVNSGDMEKGVIRFEANVSLRPEGSQDLGTRTEIKNLNSFRAMTRAVEFELKRQQTLLQAGKPVLQETLGWDETTGVTVSQRSKEEAHDYRYFPEPDLPPLAVEAEWVERIQAALPELPADKRQRFASQYGLSDYTAAVLTVERQVAAYFELAAAAAEAVPAEKIANWLSGDLFGLANEAGLAVYETQVAPEHLADLVRRVETGEINATSGKDVLAEMVASGQLAQKIIAQRGLAQISDAEEIQAIVLEVLEKNPDQLTSFLEGKETLFDWFLGQVMRSSSGRANPTIVRQELSKALQDRGHADL
ncbi:MAG: Asp-tRNA(Asn)/Glu-tRNA(Gln) amidotransferase subunit GatB [Anaerolineales bacterium]|jgi:aspartyl-tRNA(Asn)/glutamyl-tRNA(Gln) amidotransferase subunit B